MIRVLVLLGLTVTLGLPAHDGEVSASHTRLLVLKGLESVSGVILPQLDSAAQQSKQKVLIYFFLKDGCRLHFPEGYLVDGCFDFPPGITVSQLRFLDGSIHESTTPYGDASGVQLTSQRVVISGMVARGELDEEGFVASCNVLLDFEGRVLGRFRRKFLVTPLSPDGDWATGN